MEITNTAIVFAIGGIFLLFAIWTWLDTSTRETPQETPKLTEEQQDALELLRHAMIKGYKIQSHVRITNEDGMDVFFRLECPDKVKLECKKTTLRGIKDKL